MGRFLCIAEWYMGGLLIVAEWYMGMLCIVESSVLYIVDCKILGTTEVYTSK